MPSTQALSPPADPPVPTSASGPERSMPEPAPDLSESVAGEEDPGASLDLVWPSPMPPPPPSSAQPF